MNDPERLLHGPAASLATALLRAGADEVPARTAMEKTLLAVGAGAATLAAAGTVGAATAASAASAGAAAAGAAGATAATSTLGLAATVKLLAVGAVAGVAVSGAAWGVSHGLSPARDEAPPASHAAPIFAPSAPAAPMRAQATAPSAAPEAPTPTEPEASDPSAKAFPLDETPPPPPLAAEVALVDRAHQSLARGDANGALAALAPYEQRFEEPRLLPEVLALRMEAADKLGDTTAARLWAGRLLGRFPRTAQSARAKALLGR